jgi:hypothetical protein
MQTLTTPFEIQDLLDRLDPRLDEPCAVPGCHHEHAWVGMHDVVAGLRAA